MGRSIRDELPSGTRSFLARSTSGSGSGSDSGVTFGCGSICKRLITIRGCLLCGDETATATVRFALGDLVGERFVGLNAPSVHSVMATLPRRRRCEAGASSPRGVANSQADPRLLTVVAWSVESPYGDAKA